MVRPSKTKKSYFVCCCLCCFSSNTKNHWATWQQPACPSLPLASSRRPQSPSPPFQSFPPENNLWTSLLLFSIFWTKITPPCRQAPSPHPSGCNRSSPKFPDSVEKSSSVSEKLNFTIYSSVSENVYHKLIKNTWPSWRTDRLYRCHFVVQLLDLLPLLLFFGHHVLKIF